MVLQEQKVGRCSASPWSGALGGYSNSLLVSLLRLDDGSYQGSCLKVASQWYGANLSPALDSECKSVPGAPELRNEQSSRLDEGLSSREAEEVRTPDGGSDYK